MNSKTHFVIYHRHNDDPKSGRVPDLELDVINADHIFQNVKLLSVFQSCVTALSKEGLSLTVTGEEDE